MTLRFSRLLPIVFVLAVFQTAIADDWEPRLASHLPNGETSNGELESFQATKAISADGRYMVYASRANNLVAGLVDTNNSLDVFLVDSVTGTTTLVSHSAASPLTTGNGLSYEAVISADGNWVAFSSTARNLITGVVDANFSDTDVFLYERTTGALTLVSRSASSATTTANDFSWVDSISEDGRFVLFHGTSSNIVPGQVDTNGGGDIYLFDRNSGTNELVSHSATVATQTANAYSAPVAIGRGGERILFISRASNLIAGVTDTNAAEDVFLLDRPSGVLTLVSRSHADPMVAANGLSRASGFSSDGEHVLFGSTATNLGFAQDDANGTQSDVFVFHRATNGMSLVSRVGPGSQTTLNGASFAIGINAEGTRVLFRSIATNALPGIVDLNGSAADLFISGVDAQGTQLVSHAPGSSLVTANAATDWGVISRDGDRVVFRSEATNLVAGQLDDNLSPDAFHYSRSTGSVGLVSRAHDNPLRTADRSTQVIGINPAGMQAVIASHGSNIVDGVQDRNGFADLVRVPIPSGPGQLLTLAAESFVGTLGQASTADAISADGRFAFFTTSASNVDAAVIDLSFWPDAVAHDVDADINTFLPNIAASNRPLPDGSTYTQAASANGEWVLVVSFATNLVPGMQKLHTGRDVYLVHRPTGQVTLVSHAAGNSLSSGDAESIPVAISADGSVVLFMSSASNIRAGVNDANGTNYDIYVYDHVTGENTLVTPDAANPASTADGHSTAVALSADGSTVLFHSLATNLVAGVSDTNGTLDVFVFDRATTSVALLSHAAGSLTSTSSGESRGVALSADGNRVLFDSRATNLVAGQVDGNGTFDVFLYTRSTGSVELVSHANTSLVTTGNGRAAGKAISADGEWVAFDSNARDVVIGQQDSNFDQSDVFLYAGGSTETILVSRRLGSAVTTPSQASTAHRLSADGRRLLYASAATDVLPGLTDANGTSSDVFVFDRLSVRSSLLSRASGQTFATANGLSTPIAMSADGHRVLFRTMGKNLVANAVDANDDVDSYVSIRHFNVVTQVAGQGAIEPAGPVRLEGGTSATFTITPSPGAQVVSVAGCGGNWTGGGTYATGDIEEDCTIVVTFAEFHPSLTYVAGPNGQLSGTLVQTVDYGGNGDPVNAIPDAGHHFSAWSDGRIDNPRIDSGVTSSLSVTALFANESPDWLPLANIEVLEDAAATVVHACASDRESAPETLSTTAQSALPALVPDPLVTPGVPSGCVVLALAPVPNANGGPAVIGLRAIDPVGAIGESSFAVTVAPVNDAPTWSPAQAQVSPLPRLETQVVADFALVDLGPPDEDAAQMIADFHIESVSDPGQILEPGSVDILNNRSLEFRLTGTAGSATVTASVQDSGGTANGGVDRSPPVQFQIQVGTGTDLQAGVSNGRTDLLDGDRVTYSVVMANAGPNAVIDALLGVQYSASLTDVVWTCRPDLSTGPCPVPASGAGSLQQLLVLGTDQFVRFDVTATAYGPAGAFATITVDADVPSGMVNLVPANDRASDDDPIMPVGLFRDDFESGTSALTAAGAQEALSR